MSKSTEFAILVKECREKLLNKVIHNASFEHAKEIVKNLLEVAGEQKEDIRIVTGKLNRDFYEDLCGSLRETLDKGVKIQLAILNAGTDLKGHCFTDRIRQKNGEIFMAKENISFPHFLLVGDNRFRLETDHAQTKAVANFNDPNIGNFLKGHFDDIIANTNAIEKL